MDTVGTYEVYKELSRHHILTALHKFYDVDDFKEMNLNKEYFMVSTGINEKDFERLVRILNEVDVKFICIDVANGYMNRLCDFCKTVRVISR